MGLVVLMEGADGIRSVDELAEWHESGRAPDRTCMGRHALRGRHRRTGTTDGGGPHACSKAWRSCDLSWTSATWTSTRPRRRWTVRGTDRGDAT